MQNPPVSLQACPSDPALRAMFEARKRVFVDLLKWDVPVLDDAYEIDQFDTPVASYLVRRDRTVPALRSRHVGRCQG